MHAIHSALLETREILFCSSLFLFRCEGSDSLFADYSLGRSFIEGIGGIGNFSGSVLRIYYSFLFLASTRSSFPTDSRAFLHSFEGYHRRLKSRFLADYYISIPFVSYIFLGGFHYCYSQPELSHGALGCPIRALLQGLFKRPVLAMQYFSSSCCTVITNPVQHSCDCVWVELSDRENSRALARLLDLAIATNGQSPSHASVVLTDSPLVRT